VLNDKNLFNKFRPMPRVTMNHEDYSNRQQKTISSFSTDCQQAVSGRFSPLPALFPLRDLPLTPSARQSAASSTDCDSESRGLHGPKILGPARPGPTKLRPSPARPVEINTKIGPAQRGPVNKKPGPARPGPSVP